MRNAKRLIHCSDRLYPALCPSLAGVPRRGIAAMLVIGALAVVTVVTTAYVAQKSDAPALARNAENAVRARFVAETGVDLGVAIMQCEDIDWRTCHTDGVLVQDYDFGGGTLTITVSDLDGNPPDAYTEHVILSCDGDSGGLVQQVEAEAYAPRETKEVDIDLSEFALFAGDDIDLRSGTVMRWKLAPDVRLSEPIRLGTNATEDSSVELDGSSNVVDGLLYVQEDASDSVMRNASALTPIREMNVTGNDPIPFPMPPAIDISGLPKADYFECSMVGGNWWVNESKVFNNVSGSGGARLYFSKDNTVMVILGDLTMNRAAIRIDRPVDIVVGDDLSMADSAIYVTGEGRLRLWVNGNIDVNASLLGPHDSNLIDGHTPAGALSAYYDPEAVQIYRYYDGNAGLLSATLLQLTYGLTANLSILSPQSGSTWNFDNNSVVAGRLYAPGQNILFNGAALYGCAAATNIELSNGAFVHYDHALDLRLGYTNPESALYEAEGDLADDVVAAITDLSDSTILAVNTITGGDVALISPDPPSTPIVSPRTRKVYSKWSSVGVSNTGDAY